MKYKQPFFASKCVFLSCLCLSIFSVGCGTRIYDAPTMNVRRVSLEKPTTEEGKTAVEFHTDIPSSVRIVGVDAVERESERNKTLCTRTPCSANLKPGRYRLVFDGTKSDDNRISTAEIEVTDTEAIVKHTLGEGRDWRPGLQISANLLTRFALPPFLGIGAAGLAIGLPNGDSTWTTIGGIGSGIGIGLIVLIAYLHNEARPIYQPGTTSLEAKASKSSLSFTPNGLQLSF